MKKAILLLPLLLFLAACSKQKQQCWVCNAYYYLPINEEQDFATFSVATFCDKTQAEIKEIETAGAPSQDYRYMAAQYSNCELR